FRLRVDDSVDDVRWKSFLVARDLAAASGERAAVFVERLLERQASIGVGALPGFDPVPVPKYPDPVSLAVRVLAFRLFPSRRFPLDRPPMKYAELVSARLGHPVLHVMGCLRALEARELVERGLGRWWCAGGGASGESEGRKECDR